MNGNELSEAQSDYCARIEKSNGIRGLCELAALGIVAAKLSEEHCNSFLFAQKLQQRLLDETMRPLDSTLDKEAIAHELEVQVGLLTNAAADPDRIAAVEAEIAAEADSSAACAADADGFSSSDEDES